MFDLQSADCNIVLQHFIKEANLTHNLKTTHEIQFEEFKM